MYHSKSSIRNSRMLCKSEHEIMCMLKVKVRNFHKMTNAKIKIFCGINIKINFFYHPMLRMNDNNFSKKKIL